MVKGLGTHKKQVVEVRLFHLSHVFSIAPASSFAQIIGETSGYAPEITASCSDFLRYPMARRGKVCRHAIQKDGSLEFSENWWILDDFQ